MVAFRVISGHPDVADVPDDLLTLVRKALAKEPAERPTASTLATECTALISSQSTHALTRGTQSTTTLVADLVAAQWDLPTLDDTAWTAAPRLTTRRRAFLLAAAGIATFTVAAGGSYTVLGHGVYRADSPTSVAAPSGSIRTAVPPSASPAVSTEAPLAASAKTDSASPTAPPADPQPAFTRADKTQPSLDEWAEARDSMTPAERDMTAAINRDLGDYLRQDYGLEGAQVTFNPAAQTMFVTVGPSITVSNNGGDYTDLIRSVMFAVCSYGNEELKTNITWPYGRVAVVYRESMAHPIIADHRVVTNSMYCRV